MIFVKRSVLAIAAVSLLTAAGSASVSAQEGCGFMYQRVMQAYQAQSPHYGQMLNHYNARCLSGSSDQPAWGGEYGRQRYDYDRHEGYGYEPSRRGW